MITEPTVLILGAGSSVHMGYPLGKNLINELCALRGTPVLDQLPDEWGREQAERMLTQLSRGAHYSIDAFLELFEEWVPLGKFLIAQNMKGRERVDRLFPPADSGPPSESSIRLKRY